MFLRILGSCGFLFAIVTALSLAGYYAIDRGAAKPKAEQPVESLPNYHTAAVHAFGQTPGFGVGRMKLTRQAIQPIFVSWSPGELESDESPIDVPELAKVHRESIGVLSGDRNRHTGLPLSVASRHGDRSVNHWTLSSVDLVALVDHEAPIVYITANLPERITDHAMGKKDENLAAYTRSLDFFEMAALEKLMKGEETFVRAKENTLRMVGALRANRQCLECHTGKEGDLFGAFSYTLSLIPQVSVTEK